MRDVPIAQMVKNLPAMQETWVRSLGQEDPRDSLGFGGKFRYQEAGTHEEK